MSACLLGQVVKMGCSQVLAYKAGRLQGATTSAKLCIRIPARIFGPAKPDGRPLAARIRVASGETGLDALTPAFRMGAAHQTDAGQLLAGTHKDAHICSRPELVSSSSCKTSCMPAIRLAGTVLGCQQPNPNLFSQTFGHLLTFATWCATTRL